MERPEGILFLCVLWFIMGGQPTLYRKTCNIFNLLALLLFFKMILLQGGSIGLESLLHYKENLTCFYVFMHVRY